MSDYIVFRRSDAKRIAESVRAYERAAHSTVGPGRRRIFESGVAGQDTSIGNYPGTVHIMVTANVAGWAYPVGTDGDAP